MVKIKIALNNPGGELNSVTVEELGEETSSAAAVGALMEMLADLPYLSVGDTITVTEVEG